MSTFLVGICNILKTQKTKPSLLSKVITEIVYSIANKERGIVLKERAKSTTTITIICRCAVCRACALKSARARLLLHGTVGDFPLFLTWIFV